MGIRCTEYGEELGAQSKSIYGEVEIRSRRNNDGWEVYNVSEGKVLFSSPYKDYCYDYKASMYDLFRLVAKVPWRVDVEEDDTF